MHKKVTYRQQFTRCGKQRCRKCKEGAGHGPYWYAYWSSNGRTISKYIGINPPADLAQAQPDVSVPGAPEQTLAGAERILPKQAATQPKSEAARQPLLRVYLLGQFRIESRKGDAWIPITTPNWQRRRARALLGCLLSTSGRRMGREQAMEALWPDLDIDTASNRLNGAVHEARQVLEPELARPAASRLLRLERDVLMLAEADQVWVDADAFEALLNTANALSDAEQVEQVIVQALKLYDGDYLLEELYSEWAAPRRESLRRGWMGLLLKLAELRAARGALTSAIEPLDRLLSSDPTHETAVRRLMILLSQLDRRGEALRIYQRLVDALERDYDSEPLPETTSLYKSMRTGTFEAPPLAASVSGLLAAHQTSPGSSDEQQPQKDFAIIPRPTLQLGRHNQSKLVGREHELELIHQFLLELEHLPQRRKEQKLAHLLLLMGEPGIGKTRLAEELSSEANLRGWSVVWAHAYEQEGTVPYRPWTEIFRTLLKDIHPSTLLREIETQTHRSSDKSAQRELPAMSAAQAKLAHLSTLVPELDLYEPSRHSLARSAQVLPFEQERLHLWEAATAVLGILSHATPLLLVLDDLHWTDDSSLELLAYVVRHVGLERIAIIATCRDVELAPTSSLRTLINDLRREQAITTVSVQPLDETHIGTLVAHLPEHVVQNILTRAGGNPFFAEELARVSESGQSAFLSLSGESAQSASSLALDLHRASAGSKGPAAMPETIMAVLDRRLSRLSDDCQALLGKVAVLGGSFEFELVSFMTGEPGTNEDTLLDLLEESLRAGLLTEEGKGTHILYHFWHPLIVSHLYDRLSAARRAQLHRRAAHALMRLHSDNETEVAAAITHHLVRGGGDATQVARYAELAGNRAYILSAYSEVEHFYRVVIEARAPGVFEAGSDLEQTIENPLHLASLFERIAECSRIHGNFEETRRLYERVLALRALHLAHTGQGIDAGEAQRQALIWREIGRAWSENGNYEQATRCLLHGQQVMIEAGVTNGAAWACMLLSQGNIDWRTSQNDEARSHALEALQMMEHAIQQQGKDAQDALQPGTSELPTRTSQAMTGNPLELGHCHGLLGIVDETLSQHSSALQHLRLAQHIFEQHDTAADLTLIYGNLGAVYVTIAEYETGRVFFQRAIDMAKRSHNLPMISFLAGNLGDIEARTGNLREAEAWSRQSLTLAEQINDPEQESWAHIALAGTLLDRGRMEESLDHIRRGLAMGWAIKSVLCTGNALVTLGEWRTTRSARYSSAPGIDGKPITGLHEEMRARLLAGSKKALQRALTMDGLNTEIATEGKLALARAFFLCGEIESARQEATDSLLNAETHEITRVIARARRLLGRILAAQGNGEEASAFFEQASALFEKHGMRLDYARALHRYGEYMVRRDMPGEPRHQHGLVNLRRARDIFEQCGALVDLAWVEGTLASPDQANAGV